MLGGFMTRSKYPKKTYNYTGQSVKDKRGRIVSPSIFGYKEGQIKVTALGRARDTIRLTNVSTGEKHIISRQDYEKYKEELRAGYFKSKESFFKATYWKTTEGKEAQSALASQNFETMLDKRYSDNPEFAKRKSYILELFKNLTNDEKADFFEEQDKLVRDLWKYDYALSAKEYPELENMSELEYIEKKLEDYFQHNPNKLRRIYHASVLEQLGYDMYQMIRNG